MSVEWEPWFGIKKVTQLRRFLETTWLEISDCEDLSLFLAQLAGQSSLGRYSA